MSDPDRLAAIRRRYEVRLFVGSHTTAQAVSMDNDIAWLLSEVERLTVLLPEKPGTVAVTLHEDGTTTGTPVEHVETIGHLIRLTAAGEMTPVWREVRPDDR